MADCCEQCAHYITDDEFGDYCGVIETIIKWFP